MQQQPTYSKTMATKKKANGFEIHIESADAALKELTELRSGRGGRESKYKPIADAAAKLAKDKVIKVPLAKNEVGGLRGYLSRNFGEEFEVKSSKTDSGEYMAFVIRAADVKEAA